MPLQIGALLSDRYRIVRVLGQGGMGAVYLATDESLGLPCAVKENLNLSPDSERLFRREATLLASLRHRNLPRVTNHFVLDNQQYLVMDYVEGEDLKQRLERQGALPERLVRQWAEQLCDALGYLHSLTPPVVHRDIKPANIKLTPGGEIMLVDFGVARPTTPGDPQGRETATNTLAYTPGFTPPEQYGLGRTDARADQYALAATLYMLLTGQAPPDSVERLLGNVTLILPNALRPELSAGLVAAITRALEVQPEDRYPTVAAFRVALLSGPPSAMMVPPSADATIVRPAAGTPPVLGGPPPTMMVPPSADGTLIRPPVAASQVPAGATMLRPPAPASASAPAGPPPTLFERPPVPATPATLYEPGGPPTPTELPTGKDVGRWQAGPSALPQFPPAPPPPTAAMPYTAGAPIAGMPTAGLAAPPPTGALPTPRSRPRWLLPLALGCGFVVLALTALAGGSALGLYLTSLTATPTLGATSAPASVTGPAVDATATPSSPTAGVEASATPEAPATAAAPPTETITPEPTLTLAPNETAAPAGTPIGGGGGRLAFISKRDGQFFQVYTINVDGSDLRQVTTDPTDKWSSKWPYNGTQLAWSPDGRQLLYVANGDGKNVLDLWVIDADGGNPQNLTHTAGDDVQPSWCSDGTIWFASNRINGVQQIFGTTLADLLGDLRPFNFSGTHNNPREFDPAPYPDCQRLMFTSTLDGAKEIWRYFPDCPECYRKVRTLKELNGRAEEPALSPDGLLLAYTRVLPDGTEIILGNADDSTTNNQLTSSLKNFSPQWSPDGQWLTFVSERDGNREVYVMTTTGAQQTNVTQNAAHDTDPVWQPREP